MLGEKGEKAANIINLAWVFSALAVAYSIKFYQIAPESCSICLTLSEHIPSIHNFAIKSKYYNAMFFVVIYCFFTWPLILYLHFVKAIVINSKHKHLTLKHVFIYWLLFFFGVYMSFIHLEGEPTSPMLQLEILYYYKLYFSVLICCCCFLTMVVSIYHLAHHFDLIKINNQE